MSEAVGWTIGRSVVRLFGRLVVRSFGRTVIRSYGHSVVRSFGCVWSRTVGRLVSQSVNRLNDVSYLQNSVKVFLSYLQEMTYVLRRFNRGCSVRDVFNTLSTSFTVICYLRDDD